MNRAFRVERRSVFGYVLARALFPRQSSTGRTTFLRLYASIVARPHYYHEQWELALREGRLAGAVEPTESVTLTRLRVATSALSNMSEWDVINILIQNGVPPSWIAHSYPFGLAYLDYHYGSSQHAAFYHEIDDERLRRLEAFGPPPAIERWAGWWTPGADDLTRVHLLLEQDAQRKTFSLNDERWYLVGQPIDFLHLRRRTDTRAIILPPQNVTMGHYITPLPTTASAVDEDITTNVVEESMVIDTDAPPPQVEAPGTNVPIADTATSNVLDDEMNQLQMGVEENKDIGPTTD